jgi:hypothetical protein
MALEAAIPLDHAEERQTFGMLGTPMPLVSELSRRHLILVFFALAPAKSDADFEPTPARVHRLAKVDRPCRQHHLEFRP